MTTKHLVAISLVIAIAMAIVIRILDPDRLSALGSILAGAGSLLAVLWFSAGLRYQSRQLEDQRQQFVAQFEYLKESGRRDALLLVQGILERAEEKAISGIGGDISISELPAKYIDSKELKTILESIDSKEVLDACAIWMKKEGAALTLMQGIKSAAEIYLRSLDAKDIDYSTPAEEFYFIYSPRFANEPFFNSLAGPANMLSEIMVRFRPLRDATNIAFISASSKAFTGEIVKMEKLHADIKKHLADGYPLPEIAKNV